jgi:hypothetical protein
MSEEPVVSLPLDALDDAFHLPDTITDVRLRRLYEVLVFRMRAEARDLPMNTVQQLLIERIASNYVYMRDKENSGQFASPASQKDFNTFWLSMTQEFNRMLTKADTLSGNDKRNLLRDVQRTILATVNGSVQDPKTRAALLRNMAAAFENVKI